MDKDTLFAAYVRCRDEMDRSREAFGGMYGIAISDAPVAIRYQRYSLLAGKIERRFDFAGDLDERVCPVCNYPLDYCDGRTLHNRRHIGQFQRAERERRRAIDRAFAND